MNKKHKVIAGTLADCIRENAVVHGISWTAQHYARKGVNVSVVRFALFGKY